VGSISAAATRRRFCLVLVKPSHYDDDGYVIQWLRSAIPSNSLASLYGVVRDCAERGVLAPQFELEIHAFDETNSRIRPARLAALIAAAGNGMAMLAGVQSNQFPRALDLARPLRERGIQVAIGGFHVSGVLSMLNGVDADLEKAKATFTRAHTTNSVHTCPASLADLYVVLSEPPAPFLI